MPANSDHSKNAIKSAAQSQKPGGFKWNEVENTRKDVQEMFGFVPNFINNIVDQALPGAWSETKALRFSSDAALESRLNTLIALAVGTQIPCEYINYFEQTAATGQSLSRQEQLEAVLMAAITRHWSTVLSGSGMDKDEFRKEVDQVMAFVKKMMEEAKGQMPPLEMFQYKPASPEEALKDIEKTLGLVPKFFRLFPKQGLPGAWSEFKGLQLSPFTTLTAKEKELIGLAVAAQIPCEYCIYFHRSAAKLNGASDIEMQEAIAMSALTRHWSALFHRPEMSMANFKKDADQMLQNMSQRKLQ